MTTMIWKLGKRCLGYGCLLGLSLLLLQACTQPEAKTPPRKEKEFLVIPGKNDTLPEAVVQQGEVLIAYSDCYTCHKEDRDSVGPPFRDIARRYPTQQVYIDLLARKVISGGFGVWGHAKMSAHPKVPMEDAQKMVSYILSMEPL